MQKLLINICVLILFTSCISQNNINMSTPSAEYYTFQKNHDKVWDATLNHISSHYTIDNIDINTKTIRAHFKTNTPNSLLDCGKIKDTGILPDGTPFTYIYNGADSPVYTISKINHNYMHNTRTLKLEGNIQVSLQNKNKNETIINIKTHYTLSKENIYQAVDNKQKKLKKKHNENYKKETISFYANEVGEFSINSTENSSANAIQCIANTRMTDSIIKEIAQRLEKE